MFTDRVTVELSAGKGGNGVVAWRREKFIPKGGPSGGNGGRGGSVIFQADSQLHCLDMYRNRKILKAENGANGGSNCRQGRSGSDLVLKVPCGTVVKDIETGQVLHDLTQDKEKWTLLEGGRGGRGNDSFKTPTNRAPNFCTMGTEGKKIEVELELKLIADVGLIGFPNAGKSTLISTLANMRVKIAAYPFTTLQPNIGFIQLPDYKRIYIADIPGIIEGASANKGLGLEFLKHIERTKVLIYVLDASATDGRDPLSDLKVLMQEIKNYNPEMLNRPSIIALNKIDVESSAENIANFLASKFLPDDSKIFQLSAAYGENIEPFLKELSDKVFSIKS